MFIIAECGNNHGGDLGTARAMIRSAKECGCDAVKFQTYKTDQLVGITDEHIFKHLRQSELSKDMHLKLMECCYSAGIKFISSAFDIDSINLLAESNVKTIKIPSGQIANKKYLEAISKAKWDIILSTGMSIEDDIRIALDILSGNNPYIFLLHCNSAYPTPMADVNLKVMKTLQNKFNLPVGLSDHTLGIEVPIAACALGADVLEKHFTLDRNMEGPDQKMSTEPKEMACLVRAVRNIELALGDGIKRITESEKATLSRKDTGK